MEKLLGPMVRYLVLVAALAVLGAGCGRGANGAVENAGPDKGIGRDAEAPIKVDLTPVSERPMPRFLTLSGTLTPNEESEVAAGASGKVLATYVERGMYVKKGAVLAKLDRRTLESAAAEASAQLESSRAQQALAKSDCERTQRLFDKGAISRVEYDKAHAGCTTAEWTSAAAAARKASTATALADTEIKAPFSGIVAERTVTAGEFVTPSTKVATVLEIDPLRLELTVPESYVQLIGKNMAVQFRTANDENGPPLRATVRYIGPAVRRASRDLIIEAVVNNPDRQLRPGLFVVARLDLGERPALVVPAAAIRDDGSTKRVYVAGAGEKRLEERLVQIGEARSGFVTVVAGVNKGERVVATLNPTVRDGARFE
ncbi:MAG TPA: efflux RND transporter periplasmic adaptor subunit [Polyangia bacterium]|nr:efflux RND transporter periplasmic adaptor subunit [Polyangia bacterium]